jgi:hypothetical protein
MNSSAHGTHVAHHAKGYAFHQVNQQGMNQGTLSTLPAFAKLNRALTNHANALNWTQISIDNPVRHWAQGSYKIATVDG